MKKLLALCLTVVLCLCCLASCGSAHEENEWFSEEKLTNCLVGDLPTIEKDYVNHNGEDIYVSFTSKEREAYVAEVFEYMKSQDFKYLGTRGEQASTLAGTFTTYYFKPATELSEFYVDSSYKFVYSDGTLDEGGDPIFCILTIYDYEAKNLEYGTKNFAYNTLITLRYKSEVPFSGRYALNEEEHEHTITYVSAGESGHFENYTCGCPHDHGAVPHYDEDIDLICDACGYDMNADYPPLVDETTSLTQFASWLTELNAENVAEIKTTFEYVGVAPGRLKDISRTTDKAVIADALGKYASLQMRYVEREETYIDGGSSFTIDFTLTDGTIKQLYFNNGFYAYGLDQDDISAQRFFELESIPTLEGYDSVEKYNGFITNKSNGEVREHFGEDNKLIGNADGIDLLEFVALPEGEIGLLNSTYKYTIRTEFGTLYVYNEAIFGFSGLADEAQKYYKLVNGKSFSEIIPLADYPYLYLETQFVLHNSGINVFTFNVSADCNYQFVVSGSVNENTRCIVRVYSQSDRQLVFESQSANLPDEVMALAKGEYFVIVELIEANDLAVVFTVYKQKTDTNI